MSKFFLLLFSVLVALQFTFCVGTIPEPNEPEYIWENTWPAVTVRDNANVLPYLSKIPKSYWNVTGVIWTSSQNDINVPSDTGSGLRNHFLFQSMCGLAHKAIQEGHNDIALWAYGPSERAGYDVEHEALEDMGVQCLGTINPLELALWDGEGSIKSLFSGYVLTDIANNIESSIVATVASHVYNAIIVDITDKDIFDAVGYKMLYDARNKTTVDAWKEFKDKCNNNALVMMPTTQGELRSFAITNKLFCINVLKRQHHPEDGYNFELFNEVNDWLQPNSSVYGASGYDEGETDRIVSLYGNNWVPYDWGYNTTMTSLCYPERQVSVHAKSFNPATIDFSNNDDKNFVSFYLSDGDNVQWEMNDFYDTWYTHPDVESTKTSFGLSTWQLSMIAPSWLQRLFDQQSRRISVFERGSYYFIDILGGRKNREEILWQMALEQAISMKRCNVRLLGVVTYGDTDSKAAKRGYQAMIEANDELDGVVTIAYSPYADSNKEILWFTNSKGIDIPVIRTTYSLWNKGIRNDPDEGTPTYIANKMNKDHPQFSNICIHCWSKFQDIGSSSSELGENILDQDNHSWNNTIHSSGAAKLCIDKLDETFEVVSLEELIWRIRMKFRPEQTQKIVEKSNWQIN